MNAKNKVLLNSFLYTFSSILVKAMGFILLPMYTNFLSPKDYGITNLVNNFLQIATFIVAFSLNSGIVRFYVDFKQDLEKLKRFLGTIILFVFISSIFFVSIGLFYNEFLISVFFKGIKFSPIILIALITLIFLVMYTMHQSILQAMQLGRKLTLTNLIVFFLQVCLNIILIIIFDLGAVGMLLSQLIINIGYGIYMITDLRKHKLITFCIDTKILWEALKYSLPLLPHTLSTRIASFASRAFINSSTSLSLVGLYSVSFQFGNLIDMVQSSVNKAFQPWFFEMMNKNSIEDKKELVKFSQFLLVMYSFFYMIIGLFSQEVIILMTNKRYVMAWTVVPILVIAFSVKSIYYFYVNILFYYKDATKKLFISTLSGSFADIFIAFLLVPVYGMYGAAISFLLAKIVVVVIVVYISNKYNDIGYRILDMLKTILPSFLFMSAGLYFSYTKYLEIFSIPNLLYKIIVLLVYVGFVYFTNRQMIHKLNKYNLMKRLMEKVKLSPRRKRKEI